MAVNLTVGGTTYSYPQTGDVGTSYYDTASLWAQAVTSGMLQRVGGSFPLTADVDFGAGYGLKSLLYKSRAAAIASAGIFRLADTEKVSWRNAANGADIDLLPDASGNISFNSQVVSPTEFGYLSGVTSSLQPQLSSLIVNPMTTTGDIITRAGGVADRLPVGATDKVLRESSGAPAWSQISPGSGLGQLKRTYFYYGSNYTSNYTVWTDTPYVISVTTTVPNEPIFFCFAATGYLQHGYGNVRSIAFSYRIDGGSDVILVHIGIPPGVFPVDTTFHTNLHMPFSVLFPLPGTYAVRIRGKMDPPFDGTGALIYPSYFYALQTD